MSRSGYSDDVDDTLAYGRWRAQVAASIRGKRGQAFLKELASEMDAMPDKRLITDTLIDGEGSCCTLGVVCKSRKVDVSGIDVHDTCAVGSAVGITHQLAAEIEFENDENCYGNSPESRWVYMRKWVESHIH